MDYDSRFEETKACPTHGYSDLEENERCPACVLGEITDENQSYLRGYRYGASNVRAAAGIETRAYANKGIGLLVESERPTRFALGKGRVKFVLTHELYNNRMVAALTDAYSAGYIDAFLDSVN